MPRCNALLEIDPFHSKHANSSDYAHGANASDAVDVIIDVHGNLTRGTIRHQDFNIRALDRWSSSRHTLTDDHLGRY